MATAVTNSEHTARNNNLQLGPDAQIVLTALKETAAVQLEKQRALATEYEALPWYEKLCCNSGNSRQATATSDGQSLSGSHEVSGLALVSHIKDASISQIESGLAELERLGCIRVTVRDERIVWSRFVVKD